MKRLITIMVLVLFSAAAFAEEKRFVVPIDNSPSFGPGNASVTIIEFLDYQ